MIEINLLPPELRPVERTPLPRFLVLCVGAALIVAGVFALVSMYVRGIPSLKRKISGLETKIAEKQTQAVEHDRLQIEIADIGKRQRAIQTIWESRTLWWEKLDQLVTLVPEYVGLESLAFRPGAARASRVKGKGPQSAGKLTMSCLCRYPDQEKLAEFRNVLKGVLPVAASDPEVGARFITDFQYEIVDKGWEQKEAGPEYEQAWVLEFSLELDLKAKRPLAVPAAGAPAPAAG